MRDSVRRKKAPKLDAAAGARSRAYKERVGVCLLLVGIVWIVFGQTLRHEFVNYDDHQYVYENPRITNGLTLNGMQWAFTHVHSDNWHPLTTISHMLDCQLYGLRAWGHHLTNVLLHAGAAVLLFLALSQLTGARWSSGFVAGVFAIHPLRVESVAWVAERKDVLSGVFFMLILLAYARYVRGNRPSSGRYTMIVVLFALGLMCKPTLVTLPFVLLLLDYWPLRRFTVRSLTSKASGSARNDLSGRRGGNPSQGGALPKKSIQYLLIEKIPFFVLSAASCVATLLAQEQTISTLHQLALRDRIANAMVSYVTYIGQTIWPAGLSVVYPYPKAGVTIMQPVLAVLVLLIISVVFFIWRGKYSFLLIGWLWFLGMLIPMIGLVQVGAQAHADRYTYLPQIGLYILATWGAVELFNRWRHGRKALIAFAVLVLTALMAGSYVQASCWRNSETLWNQALAHTTNNPIAECNLGNALVKKERLDEAIVHLRKALEIHADYPEANNYLGYALANQANWADAIISFRAALRVRPNYPEARTNLAISLSQLGKTDEALQECRAALGFDQNYREAHCTLALLLQQLGRREEALVHLREALRLKPDDPQVKALLLQFGAE
jgi:protein O-mannosyl-transferase